MHELKRGNFYEGGTLSHQVAGLATTTISEHVLVRHLHTVCIADPAALLYRHNIPGGVLCECNHLGWLA